MVRPKRTRMIKTITPEKVECDLPSYFSGAGATGAASSYSILKISGFDLFTCLSSFLVLMGFRLGL
jgi:hypothetical protein